MENEDQTSTPTPREEPYEKKIYEAYYNKELFKLEILKFEGQITIRSSNLKYIIEITPSELSELINKKFNSVDESYEFIINFFENKKFEIKNVSENTISINLNYQDKNIIIELKTNEDNLDLPSPPLIGIKNDIKDYNLFLKNYEIEEEFLVSEFYIIKNVLDKSIKTKLKMKEYTDEFIKFLNDEIVINIDSEKNNFKECHSKYIIKLIDYYKNGDKRILLFENFDKTLKDLLREKKCFQINEIKALLIQLNELIRQLNSYEINNIIICPENIGIIKNNNSDSYMIKLIDLFPYYESELKIKYNDKNKNVILPKIFKYSSPEIPNTYDTPDENYNNDTLTANTKSLLYNIGLLMYELFYGSLPLILDINNLKKSNNNLFDDLISKLLIHDYKQRINWNEYINHEFFSDLSTKDIFKILYQKEINTEIKELDIISEGIDENNLNKLSDFEFKNLLKLDISNNNIKDLSMLNQKQFGTLKILNVEKNQIKDIKKLKDDSLKNLEFLLLYSNSISDLDSFQNKNLSNLSYLSLSKNNIEDLSPLATVNLQNLNVLNLSFNKIKNIKILLFLKIPYLKELYLNNNSIIEIEVFSKVNLKELEILHLENNNIKNINVFKEVNFQNKLKELNLVNNPIIIYDSLNLCYFPSLEKFYYNLNDYKFHILSIKIKLYGYEFEKGKEDHDNISVLFIPDETYIFDTSNLNYQNSFKIITNKKVHIQNLKYFFIRQILEIDSELIEKNKVIAIRENMDEKTYESEGMNNYKIFYYNIIEKSLEFQIKMNNFSLIKQYRNVHKIYTRYNRIPKYLESKENNYYLNIICNLNKGKENYYNSLLDKIIDNNFILYSFLKKYYYYNFFPLIFINSKYYKDFLEFLFNCPKYIQKFNVENLSEYLILSSDKEYKYKHSIQNELLIFDIVENFAFYDINIITGIINQIQEKYKVDYKQYINEWIMFVMDKMVEFLLFILNIKPNYYICPLCNNSILYIINLKNNNNEKINIINNKLSFVKGNNYLINEDGESIKINNFDHSFYKSIIICSNLNNILLKNNFQKNDIIEFKKEKQNSKNNNFYPANPPKKNNSINIIYHDENYKIFKDSIHKDAKRFEEASHGTFLYSNSIKILETIMKEIQLQNNGKNKNKFLLITTGSTFKKVIDFLKDNNYLHLIDNACIYCMKKDKYLPLMKDYKILGGVFHIPSNVVEFIEKNLSENNNLFDYSRLITYENYISNYYKLHEIISKFYSNYFQTSINIVIDLLKEILDETSQGDNNLLKTIETFQNEDYEIIKQYTMKFSSYINKWLLGSDSLVYEKAGYLIGGIMYKLNEYGLNKNKGKKEKCILYRGIYLNYLDALVYTKNSGKIISFQTFLSTSSHKSVANFFSRIERTPLEEKKNQSMFSTLINIKYNWEEGFFPLCFDISELSKYKHEKELLFHPYSFFRINNYDIDLIENILTLDIETIGKKEILEEQIKLGKKIRLNESQKFLEIENV